MDMKNGVFIIGAILTIFFAGLTLIFWWKIRKLKDLRTLRLGRLSFFALLFLWVTINGIIGSGLALTDLHQKVLMLLLIAEAVLIFLILPMTIGIVVPISMLY